MASTPFLFLNHQNMANIYNEYNKVVSNSNRASIHEELKKLSDKVQAIGLIGEASIPVVQPMVAQVMLTFPVDSPEFGHIYNFVHFICREKGMINIAVGTAVKAWRMILSGCGVFPLVEYWCDFVGKNCRYNVTMSTWSGVLYFIILMAGKDDIVKLDDNCCWPTLVDEFVDHMINHPPVRSPLSVDFLCAKLSKMKMEGIV